MRRRILLLGIAVILIHAGWASAGGDQPPPKYGPRGAPYAAPLWQSHEYFQSPKNAAPDFWALITHYTGQSNNLSCSVAAVAMVQNAIARTQGDLSARDANYQQAHLINDVKAAHWKKHVTGTGWMGRKGLTLQELEEVVLETFKTYGLKEWTVSSRSFQDNTPRALGELRALLEANEASVDDFMILHFLQDRLTNDPGGPYAHISPVGSYDAASGRVLILDVDREYYGPYWVSTERLLAALSARTPSFGYGGLLVVRRVSR